ncbi:MAG TPA: CBM35 domain-containing protein [Chitinophaga sp.]|uniref:CBM35 domain-containing protein n=1 Tax=Chitinophaga sp. TaxID=1869181 RepID=UPI002DB80B76|nr:CBM35 domain-containing protein [Chitinophaga sp.]HEU4551486.1 CBM35 domain-containing protein [Chitinophaga sp.]
MKILYNCNYVIFFAAILCLYFTKTAAAQSFEAESGTLGNGANTQSCSSCSGSTMVGNLGGPSNGTVVVPVNVSSAGIYNLTIYYCTADPRVIYVTPNNGNYTGINCAPSGGWSTVGSTSINVSLNAGSNTIRLDNGAGGWGPNIDKLLLQPVTTINFGAGNYIYYNLSTGKYNVYFNNNLVITDAYASCSSNSTYYSHTGYTSRVYAATPVTDAFGSGTKHTITLTGGGLISMQQVFYTYPGKHYFFTEVLLNGAGANCYRMSPLTTGTAWIPGSGDMRALKVPFDNDAWVRYDAQTLGAANFTGSEVAALYDNTSRNGLVIGSVEHMHWKTGVTVTANGNNTLSALTAYGGYTDGTVTHDGRGHGWVNVGGATCKSPKILVDYESDWRTALETYGSANALAEPRYISTFNGGTPFGWNSWGAIQSSLTLAKAKSVVDFFADSCTGFRNSDSTLYIDLDSYWDNLATGGWTGDFSQLTNFANYCKSKGFKPGIYWAPFVDWGKNATGTVEGTAYQYQDCWTKVNGAPVDLDGARAMDPTHPGTRGRIAYLLGKFKACGFEMIKLDFLGHATLEADSYYDNTVHTGMEAFRKGMEYVTDQLAGTMLTYAAISPNLATGRYVHMRRIACDAYKNISETGYTLNSTTYGWWQKNLYQYADADHIVFGTASVGENRARLTSGLVTGTLITGDDYSTIGAWTPTARQLLQNAGLLNIARNGNGKAFRPVEGNTGNQPNELFTAAVGSYQYLAIVNYGSSAKTYTVNLGRVGLSSGSYAAKELFSGAVSNVSGTLTVTVPAADAVIYRFETGAGSAAGPVYAGR